MDLSHKKSVFLLTISSIIIFIIVYFIASGIFQLKSYNFMVGKTSINKIASPDIILVVVDDESLSELGRWPWKRTQFSKIFDFLENHTNTKVFGYDALIVAPDIENKESDEEFYNQIQNFSKLVAGVGYDYENFRGQINEGQYNSLLKEKSHVNIIDRRSDKYRKPSQYKSFTQSPIEYLEKVPALGTVNTYSDSDGYIRKIDQIVNYKGELYPSMGLLLYSKMSGINTFTLTDKYLIGEKGEYRLKMPIHNKNGIAYSYICFYNSKDGMYSHQKVSASDVIRSYELIKQGKKPILDPKIFDNKIVFVGANAQAQALRDVIRTPTSDSLAGLDLQATNFDNIYKNEFFINSSEGYNFMLALLLFLFVFVIICTLPIPAALLSTVTLMFLYFIFAYMMYSNKIAIDLLIPEVFMVIAIGVGYSYKFFSEGKKKEKIQSAMGKYISRDVMKNVIDNIDSVKLGGKRANVTVLFTDIRGFTTISEQLSAEEVTKILNEYFSALVPIIDKHNGILNKFMGDALLAVFGEPIQDENHPINAVRCADAMLKEVKKLQEKWLDEGKPKIDVGIGIATGEAFVGNIGSEERLEYTVIGDTVNTASRIENYNKVYKTKFLISEQTFERVQKYVDVLKIRDVSIRGKSRKINIYEVLKLIKRDD